MDHYLREISEQPVVARRLYDAWINNPELQELGKQYRNQRRPLVFLGMGSSNYSPVILRSRFSQARIPFHILEAGEFVYYESESVPSDAWVIAISQSGESLETRVAVEGLKGKVERIIAITNESDSTLAKLADTTLLLHAGKEVGSTTKTFINTLLGLHLLANEIEGKERVTCQHVEQLISYLESMQGPLQGQTKEMIAALNISTANTPDPVHFISRGQTLATALQTALILTETTDLFTQALPGGSFRHGPYELAGPQHRAVFFAPSGQTQHLLINMAKEIHSRGSHVVLISDTQEEVPFFKLSMPTMDEQVAPLLYFLPIELFGWNLSQLRGRVPGMLQQMGKVTTVE